MYYIYILHSKTANKYYVGYSSNPWQRLKQHNSNTGEKFTGKYSEWELKAFFEVSEKESEAMQIEKFIKKQKSKVLIEKLIDPDFLPKGILSQLIRVPHVRD